jgi:hypothetical protein
MFTKSEYSDVVMGTSVGGHSIKDVSVGSGNDDDVNDASGTDGLLLVVEE